MPADFELLARLAVTMVLGGVIGLERELSNQAAGLRTHISVALGSTLFALVSAYGFYEFEGLRATSNLQVDVTRVASNIVTGVGFLGGGVILKDGGSIRGLTTAGSLWVTAAVGLAVGLGAYMPAAACAFGLVLTLTGLRRPRVWLRRRFGEQGACNAVIRVATPADAAAVLGELRRDRDVDLRSLHVEDEGADFIVRVDLRGAGVEAALVDLVRRADVIDVDLAPTGA